MDTSGDMTESHHGVDGGQLRAAAAGILIGLGGYFVVQHLSLAVAASQFLGVYDLPFLALSVAVLYSGYWLMYSDVSTRCVGRVAVYSLAGFLALIAVAVWLGGDRALDLHGSVALALDVGTVGASSGLLVGLEGERRRIADAGGPAARQAEERFAFFNRLLRHHLLNGVAVVRGYAELLAEAEEEPPEEVELIQRRSDEIVDLVKNVETLGKAVTGELTRHPVDPHPPLRAAIEAVDEERLGTPIEGDLRGDGRVLANGSLDDVFAAVLEAAVDAADGGPVVVATSTDHEFVASFAFEGAPATGIEPQAHPGEHGEQALGLYLAETLVEYFDGGIERTASDDLIVRLPLA